jgi:penicillin amidase
MNAIQLLLDVCTESRGRSFASLSDAFFEYAFCRYCAKQRPPMRQCLRYEEEKRSHPFLRLFAGFLLLIILAAVLGVLGGAWWLKHAMRDSLPQLDGDIRLPGLSAPVTVHRDQHGVPHIEAATLDDLFEAQGYITAQDRLWQMDMARRMAAGEAAEVLGKRLVDHDRLERVLQMRATAERMAASLPEHDRHFFEDYARGVNEYIDSHRGHLPAEFRLLMYKPRAWQPVDSILIGLSMVQILDEHWPEKLEREKVETRIGPTLAADLYPTGSWRDHPPTVTPPDLTAPQPVVPEVPLDESQTSLHDLLHLRKVVSGTQEVCRECIPGSNEWAVAGVHTASGKPLLSNDMHLDHGIPNTWYEIDLKSGNFHAAGVTIAGMPFVTAGHNDHIAWGYTSLYGDTQDVYVEQTNSRGEYLGTDGWHPIEHTQETIHVRGGQDVTVDIKRTEHGPVLNPLLPSEKRTLSLRWVAYDPKAADIPLFEPSDLSLIALWGPKVFLLLIYSMNGRALFLLRRCRARLIRRTAFWPLQTRVLLRTTIHINSRWSGPARIVTSVSGNGFPVRTT